MTLAKFGIQYTARTTQQLKDFAAKRGVQPPSRNDRKFWLQALRLKDKAAKINFLDYPPEIRNMVYEQVFLPGKDHWSPKAISRHPQILATCRQVHDEAIGVFHRSIASVSLTIDLTEHQLGVAAIERLYHYQNQYSVEVSVDGRRLVRGETGDPHLSNPWPHHFVNVRSLHLIANLHHSRTFLEKFNAGMVQANHSFRHMYRLVSESTSIRKLHIAVHTHLHVEDLRQYTLLSPICASSAKVENFVFRMTGGSSELRNACNKAVRCYRQIRSLEKEIKALIEIFSFLEAQEKADRMLSEQSPIICSLRNALQWCTEIQRFGVSDRMYDFAQAQEVLQTINVVTPFLDGVHAGIGESKVVEATDELKTLKTKRDEWQQDQEMEE